jgi:hypothetical protein
MEFPGSRITTTMEAPSAETDGNGLGTENCPSPVTTETVGRELESRLVMRLSGDTRDRNIPDSDPTEFQRRTMVRYLVTGCIPASSTKRLPGTPASK